MMNIEQLRQLTPHLVKMGPKWFRRLAVDLFPNAHLQTVKHVSDTMSERSQNIFHEKKVALNNGDEAVLRQVGEGRDIMSILRAIISQHIFTISLTLVGLCGSQGEHNGIRARQASGVRDDRSNVVGTLSTFLDSCFAHGLNTRLLVFAATDTTSNTLARILQSLAEHSDVQSKLREELLHAGANTGNLSYDDLMKLPLLDAVCRETLRL